MSDESTPNTQNLTPSTLWRDLVQAEAAARPLPTPESEIRDAAPLRATEFFEAPPYDDIIRWETLTLRAPDDRQTIYIKKAVSDRNVRAAYITGCRDERAYQQSRLERRRLGLGAFFFFGFCAGMIAAALLQLIH